MRTIWLFAVLIAIAQPAFASDRMVVHEWGTFTSLQNENGDAIAGIDADVEPLPKFVHNLSNLPEALDKGVPLDADPNVTMRLETPVVYFHPPANWSGSASYSVQFHGGLLSQFYPDAQTNLDPKKIPPITADTVGTLRWPTVVLTAHKPGPNTDAPVWLAPRNVSAADVAVGNESDRFLFYRGIGELNAPIKIVRQSDGTKLQIIMQASLQNPLSMAMAIDASFDKLWYFDMRPDGKCAFTALGPLRAAPRGDAIGSFDADFVDADYSKANVDYLRADMRKALIAQGLFADEAEAMLKTWENAYFKSPGTRVFFLVPRSWTDQILPATISGNPDFTRVMVGRIDLITPRDRAILQQLTASKGDPQNPQTVSLLHDLGRFASPMIRDEMTHRPSASLQKLLAMSRP